jgi:hypothetical protein
VSGRPISLAQDGPPDPNRDGANPGHRVSRRAGPGCLLAHASRPASMTGDRPLSDDRVMSLTEQRERHLRGSEMRACETKVVRRRSDLFAAWLANRRERKFWLAVLLAVDPDKLDAQHRVVRSMWIGELRRKLGIRTPKDEVREQTRLRVRRFRERARSSSGAARQPPAAAIDRRSR